MKTYGKNRYIAFTLRILLWSHRMMMWISTRLGLKRKNVGEEGYDILLTGTFHSANWILTHLKPLSLAQHCRRVRVVTDFPIPPLDKVEVVYPAAWLVRIVGRVLARLLTFAAVAIHSRPHVVGGFHLLLNGLTVSLLGRICGARSIYFCVGGPAEVLGGGILSENRIFERLREPDLRIESMLLRAAAGFDLIITMGTGARDFLRERGITGEIQIVSGGIDSGRFGPINDLPTWDVVFVGRLVPIKRIDILLRALKVVKEEIDQVKAVIVGDGPLRQELEVLARDLGLKDAVDFTGHCADIPSILNRSKVFVLTSQTEGLSLALMEAMMSGLPAVVSDVGDLHDLIMNGTNGFLVEDHTPEIFAERIAALLRDPNLRGKFARAARAAMESRETSCVVRQWDAILSLWRNGDVLRTNEQCAE